MTVRHFTAKKSLKKKLESLVFLKLSSDPTPVQASRFRRQERLSRFCACVLTVVMLIGIGAQIGRLVDIAVTRKNVRALQADNRLLEVSIGNLEVELMMKTQDTVICHLAQRDLGMIRLDEMYVMVLPVEGVHPSETQLMSTGYQQ